MFNQTKGLLLACLVPVLILLGMCYYPLAAVLTGEDITLQTKPVDPSDPFRGDYVILRYEAEEVQADLVEQEVLESFDNWSQNQEVYVVLAKKGGVDVPVKVTGNQPKTGIYLKGKMNYRDKDSNGNEVVNISYGLDKYYVEDNTGTEWEKASTQGNILVKAKVNKGYAILTGIEKK